jgi:hypothetical protein
MVAAIGAQREQQQGLVQARARDLNVAGRILQITDSRLNREARGFLFDGLARDLGVDPKTEYTRGMKRVILGLDPDSAGALRSMFTSRLDRAAPGQVSQRARAVINGDIPLQDVIQQASYGLREQAAERQAGAYALFDDGEQPSMLGGSTQLAQAEPPLTPRGPSPAAPASELPRIPAERQMAPRMREIAPELSAVLGLDPRERVRNIDVISQSHPTIPSSFEDQQKMANDIRQARDSTIQTMVLATQLANLVRGRPEALTPGVDVPIVGRIGANIPNIVIQLRDFTRGLGNVFIGPETAQPATAPRDWQGLMDRLYARGRGETSEQAELSARNQFLARQAARNVIEQIPLENRPPSVQDAALLNQRIESLMVPLAFAMAAAKGQTGRTLSDRDVELQLRELGRSASPELFEAALRDVVNRTYDGYQRRMLAMTGGMVPVDLVVSPNDASTLAGSELTPAELRVGLQRRSGQGAVPELGGDPTVRRVPILPTGPEGLQPSAPGGEPPFLPAPSQPPPAPPGRRGAAGYPTIEAEEQAARLRDEAELRRTERAAELRESAEGRAQRAEGRAIRAEAEQRRERIQQAFAAIGAALRGAGSAGGGSLISGGGGDQDAAAFRITPSPQRRPPTPVDAGPFQPQAPALRRR